MAFAVTLLFDAATTTAISMRWQLLAMAGVSRSMPDLGYPPHVSLAVYDELDVEAAVASLDRILGNVDQVPVTLTGFSTFGAGSGVCYAALRASPERDALHARVTDGIRGACKLYYQRGHWTPHCTVAVGLTDAEMDRARHVLEPDWRTLDGAFEAAELVEFVPVVRLRRWTLSFKPPK